MVGEKRTSAHQIIKNVKRKGILDFGDIPRSKKQIYDLAKSNQGNKMGEVESILGCNAELEQEEIIWFLQDLPSDLWVCGTNAMIGMPLSIDPRFNHGKFGVTPLTYRHHCIEAKSKNTAGVWKPAVMVGSTIIQQNKEDETYLDAIRHISLKCKLLDRSFGVVTDGEEGIIKACKAWFSKSTLLRRTRHFKANCKEKLKDIGIPENESKAFMDIVFGEDGLVESENKKDFKDRLNNVTSMLNEMEEECTGNIGASKFSVKLSMLLCLAER